MNKIIPATHKFKEASVTQTVGSLWSSGSDFKTRLCELMA